MGWRGTAAGGVSPSHAGLQGVGPAARAALLPSLHPLGSGRGREAGKPAEWLSPRDPRPFPLSGGSAGRREAGTVAPPGRWSRWGWLMILEHPAPLSLRAPSCPGYHRTKGFERVDWLGSEARKEKRSF